ncbi:cell division protein ZapA [Thermopetrobacter sp. TC1]|uniref:cell division protein ZapA n=1 Tax=Thermopetrobacter sp. TC1 TaxID=1495045 RepID=UPI00068FB681|nr:cell division protein ZapA [Thermopetrobacter sp. TC1]
MGQVIVQINGRNYTMQCEDGQEDHLRRLADMIDTEVTNIRNAVGPLGDLRLLIMASLVIADKLAESEQRIAWLEQQLETLQAARQESAGDIAQVEERAAQALESAARRLEALAAGAWEKTGKAAGGSSAHDPSSSQGNP